MITIRTARDADLDGFLTLASQVEHWFGPMVEEPHPRTPPSAARRDRHPARPRRPRHRPVGGRSR
ncbi:N-acetyltransferase, partial [Streptomyces anulatus]